MMADAQTGVPAAASVMMNASLDDRGTVQSLAQDLDDAFENGTPYSL